jgi:hypothetical protein
MVLRTAGRGRFEGQQFWGCSTYPSCRERIDLGAQAATPAPMRETVIPDGAVGEGPPTSVAGASAQARFDGLRQRQRDKLKRIWPFVVGVTVVLMLMTYLIAQSVVGPLWGGVASALVALAFAVAVVEVPQATEAWRIGAEGERKTASYLARLNELGFIVLHDRKAPGYGGNLDHVAIGPSGVWAIETKSLKGKVEIDGDSLKIGGYRQDKAVDQVYREAVAVQVALGDVLSGIGTQVKPVISLHRGELPFFNKTVRGVRLASGRQLVRLLRDGERRLSDEEIQAVALAADRVLKQAVS